MGLIGGMDVVLQGEMIWITFITDDFQYILSVHSLAKSKQVIEYIEAQDIEPGHVKGFLLTRLRSLMVVEDTSSIAMKLPGVTQKVKHPVTGNEHDLFNIIINLNDHKQPDKGRNWTREEIADWIESTLPMKEITFTAPEVTRETQQLGENTNLVKIPRLLSR